MKYIIEGGKKLIGEVKISGNKNSVLACMSAALLTDEEVVLENVPDISDVDVMIEIFSELGVKVEKDSSKMVITARDLKTYKLRDELVKRLRASILLAGPLINRMGKVELTFPGGDVIGKRKIEVHLEGFSRLGVNVSTKDSRFALEYPGQFLKGNVSVLDRVACEVIIRFFMPTKGKRIYNPFGGGVQFGFVAGHYGYEYVSSEIRQNQCDCNNAICQDFKSAKWIKSDSSAYTPEGKYDLIFSCPPYYKVEEYVDYDGKPPAGELNSIPTYEQFRDTLFEGYKKGIEALNDNCFFVVMTGDSRDKKGAYYGCEAEHELFFKQQGLYIYNKIVYLECEFTRLAQAKKTLDYRKFPKREQKILVFYKGDISKISELYPKKKKL